MNATRKFLRPIDDLPMGRRLLRDRDVSVFLAVRRDGIIEMCVLRLEQRVRWICASFHIQAHRVN